MWDKEEWAFMSVNQDATEWKKLPHPSGTGTLWHNTKSNKYQDKVPAVVQAAASGTRVVQGPYDAMGSGNALAVRTLIEEHCDKMLTIRRRDFEVCDPVSASVKMDGHDLFVCLFVCLSVCLSVFFLLLSL